LIAQLTIIRLYKIINIIFYFNFKFYLIFFKYLISPSFEHKKILKEIIDVNTYLDVGANRGQFILLLDHFFPNCKIIAFEPLKKEYHLLKKIFKKKANVKILNYAVGNKNGMIDINISNLSDSSSVLLPTKLQLKNFPGTFIVQKSSTRIKKLKNFTANIKKPIFLKIDVQGYELEVLKGSNLRHIKYIYLEGSYVELYKNQVLIKSIMKFLLSKRFKLIKRVNCYKDRNGKPIQADFLFINKIYDN
jgi:FkbM family methyltransferase